MIRPLATLLLAASLAVGVAAAARVPGTPSLAASWGTP